MRPEGFHFATARLAAIALAALVGAGAQEDPASGAAAGDPSSGPPPVRVGLAQEDDIGASLPPLVTEISKRAAKAFLAGDWRQARDAYLEILEEDPDNPLTLANLGATYLQMGALEDAKSALERALAIHPGLHAQRVTLGLVYLQGGETYLAISTLSRAVADQPQDARAHNYLAVAARDRGWIDAAERELQAAVAADPSFADAHYNLALVYMEKEPPAFELARRHYRRATELGAAPDPDLAARIDKAAG